MKRVLALACLALGCQPGVVDPMPANPPGPNDTAVVINIVGQGSVRYVGQPVVDCMGTADAPMWSLCNGVRAVGGALMLNAIPAVGWHFDHWTVGSFSPADATILTNPMSPMQTIAQGTRVLLIATFVRDVDGVTGAPGCVQSGTTADQCPVDARFTVFDGLEVAAIEARFDEAAKTTTYNVRLANPLEHVLRFHWSGPNCGTWGTQDETRSALETPPAEMSWNHPHPPCGPTVDHTDTTIRFSLIDRDTGVSLECTYVGAATGVGPACMRM